MSEGLNALSGMLNMVMSNKLSEQARIRAEDRAQLRGLQSNMVETAYDWANSKDSEKATEGIDALNELAERTDIGLNSVQRKMIKQRADLSELGLTENLKDQQMTTINAGLQSEFSDVRKNAMKTLTDIQESGTSQFGNRDLTWSDSERDFQQATLIGAQANMKSIEFTKNAVEQINGYSTNVLLGKMDVIDAYEKGMKLWSDNMDMVKGKDFGLAMSQIENMVRYQGQENLINKIYTKNINHLVDTEYYQKSSQALKDKVDNMISDGRPREAWYEFYNDPQNFNINVGFGKKMKPYYDEFKAETQYVNSSYSNMNLEDEYYTKVSGQEDVKKHFQAESADPRNIDNYKQELKDQFIGVKNTLLKMKVNDKLSGMITNYVKAVDDGSYDEAGKHLSLIKSSMMTDNMYKAGGKFNRTKLANFAEAYVHTTLAKFRYLRMFAGYKGKDFVFRDATNWQGFGTLEEMTPEEIKIEEARREEEERRKLPEAIGVEFRRNPIPMWGVKNNLKAMP